MKLTKTQIREKQEELVETILKLAMRRNAAEAKGRGKGGAK